MKYHWLVAVFESGFYSFTSIPVPIFGDSEGFFTENEIDAISNEFDKINQSGIPRKKEYIMRIEKSILSKALTELRFAEYNKLRQGYYE